MTVSAKEVQELRKISGAGMMECKIALSEAAGNIDQAFKLLREKGIAKAEKKSSREAKEGLVGIKIDNNIATIIELNSETDFVSRNSEFHKLVNSILELSTTNGLDIEKTKESASELINQAVGKIGENIVLKKIDVLEGNIYSYVHNSVKEGMGKIGVLLDLKADKQVDEIGKNICMHIAAAAPKSISKEDLDIKIIENEKEIIKQQLKETGKPENILEKMMEGKLNKFFEETTLLKQKYVIDPNLSVDQYLKESSSSLGCKISINKYLRYQIGS